MLFGITIPSIALIMGGVSLFLLLGFQTLVGMRKIKFKGALHMKVHRWAAYLILVFAAFHAVVALAYIGAL
jgi:cytochrome b561